MRSNAGFELNKAEAVLMVWGDGSSHAHMAR